MVGRHVIAEVYQVGPELTQDSERLAGLLCEAAGKAGATVVHCFFHDFEPKDGLGVAGVTGVIALAESHISVHTWPEHQYMALDVFMCGDADPELVLELLRETGLTDIDYKVIPRPFMAR